MRQEASDLIETASYTDQGGRPRNEDTAAVRVLNGTCACAVVADGLGGHGGGDAASREAVRVIMDGWTGSADSGALSARLIRAHERILAMQTAVCRMKSTAAALELAGNRMAWAYAGDTRIYHFADGALVWQTKDHSASRIAVSLGQITPDQIRFHEDRARLYRALGMEGELTVDGGETKLERGRHVFLLCSDGFWEYVYESEMERALAAAAGPEQWLDAMRSLLNGRVPADNDNNTAAALWLTV